MIGGGASPAFANACPTTVFTGLFLRGLCFLVSGAISTRFPSAASRILGLAGDSNSTLALAEGSILSQMAASLVAAVLAAAAGEVGRQKESLDGKGAIGAVLAAAATAASCGGFLCQ